MKEEVTIDQVAAFLQVNRKSAIQRMSRLVKRQHAIRLNLPKRGIPSRFKLLISVENLLQTQKFAGPNCNSKFATVELPAVDLNLGPADGDHVVEFDE